MITRIDLPKPVYELARRLAADQDLSLSELFMKLLAKTNFSPGDVPKPTKMKLMAGGESSDWRDELL